MVRIGVRYAAWASLAAAACAQPMLTPPPPPGRSAPEHDARASTPTVAPPQGLYIATAPSQAPLVAPSAGPAFAPPPSFEACETPLEENGLAGPEPRHWLYNHAKLRHSSSHGRAVGPGSPLRGTSWLNRPYEFAYEFGAFLMTGGPASNVRSGNDTFHAIQIGLDFDHYWGSQLRVGSASPTLLNTTQVGVGDPTDSLFVFDGSVLYYPWGDARIRPYYRFGVGLTELEYINDNGVTVDETLLTLPFGVGVKYQLKKWLAMRFELVDNFAIGMNETDSMHNLTLTTGFEWRFGNGTFYQGGWTPVYQDQ